MSIWINVMYVCVWDSGNAIKKVQIVQLIFCHNSISNHKKDVWANETGLFNPQRSKKIE